MDYLNIYNKTFQNEKYSTCPPDEFRYKFVIDRLKRDSFGNRNTFIDIGVGRGQMIEEIYKFSPKILSGIDLSKYSLFKNFTYFYNIDLSNIELNFSEKILSDIAPNNQYDYLSCLDVLEHIEETKIENVLCFLSKLSRRYFFTIANHSDKVDGIELHLIQKDKIWWESILSKYFNILYSEVQYQDRLFLFELEKNV